MEENTEAIVPICYTLPLTGSSFFDTMISLRARELVKSYPGVTVESSREALCLRGELSESGAAQLREELGLESREQG